MTDEQIIKAKNIIRNLHSYCFLTQSSYRQMGYKFCERDFEILHDLTDNFYRQKAEVERLKVRNDELNLLNKTATIEAIKDFAERLRELMLHKAIMRMPLFDMDIDNLVKEMTE